MSLCDFEYIVVLVIFKIYFKVMLLGVYTFKIRYPWKIENSSVALFFVLKVQFFLIFKTHLLLFAEYYPGMSFPIVLLAAFLCLILLGVSLMNSLELNFFCFYLFIVFSRFLFLSFFLAFFWVDFFPSSHSFSPQLCSLEVTCFISILAVETLEIIGYIFILISLKLINIF